MLRLIRARARIRWSWAGWPCGSTSANRCVPSMDATSGSCAALVACPAAVPPEEIAGLTALAAVLIDELELRAVAGDSGRFVYREGSGWCSRAVAAQLYAGASVENCTI
jgi:hypothetical protein